MAGRIVLVTGGTGGIGKATAAGHSAMRVTDWGAAATRIAVSGCERPAVDHS